MRATLQIAFNNLRCPETVKALIEEKVDRLERFHGRITACRIAVGLPNRRHRQGNQYVVRLGLTVPGGEIVVNREVLQHTHNGDVEAAIRDAFETAKRQLDVRTRRARR